MREVLGAEPKEAPQTSVHRGELELMRQKLILLTQAGQITIGKGFLLMIGRYGLRHHDNLLPKTHVKIGPADILSFRDAPRAY